MNLTDQEINKLDVAKESPKWKTIVDEIKQVRQGDFPPDWEKKVIHGILSDFETLPF